MKEIKSPEDYTVVPGQKSIFVAGGISNCPKWQGEVSVALAETDIVVLNPRRDDFDVTNPAMEQDQIEWEHLHILRASAYLFWFCEETLCPITLFELGKVAGLFANRPLFVGVHPRYKRKRDVRFQMLLMRPEVEVVHRLEALLEQVKSWDKNPRNYISY